MEQQNDTIEPAIIDVREKRQPAFGRTFEGFIESARWLWVLYVPFGLIEGLVLIRLFFRAVAANPANTIVGVVYTATDPLVAPFQAISTGPRIQGALIDVSTVLAIVVYVFLAWAVSRLLWLSLPVRQS